MNPDGVPPPKPRVRHSAEPWATVHQIDINPERVAPGRETAIAQPVELFQSSFREQNLTQGRSPKSTNRWALGVQRFQRRQIPGPAPKFDPPAK